MSAPALKSLERKLIAVLGMAALIFSLVAGSADYLHTYNTDVERLVQEGERLAHRGMQFRAGGQQGGQGQADRAAPGNEHRNRVRQRLVHRAALVARRRDVIDAEVVEEDKHLTVLVIGIIGVLLSILLILGDDLRTFINDLFQTWFPS